MLQFITSLFLCPHTRTTFPQTPKGMKFPQARVSCLGCGKSFNYSFAAMRIGNEIKPAVARRWKTAIEAGK